MNAEMLPVITEQQKQVFDRLCQLFPSLCCVRSEEWQDVLSKIQTFNYPVNSMLASVGSSCNSFMLILDGKVRVYQHAEDGREVTIYRIGAGDICLMSLNSLLNDRPFRGNAIAETDISVLAFAADDFHKAMRVSDAFRELVLTRLVDSVCGMMHLLHETSFESLDTRLRDLLKCSFEQAGFAELNMTHQVLAQELGSSREVISRILKKMERNGFIVLQRGKILIGKNKTWL
jgi:CRP/FNR family transcriptional regulator